MAIEPLHTEGLIRHHYKHDAESFFWVVVYDTALDELVKGWDLLTNAALLKERYPPIMSWVDEVRKFFAMQTVRAHSRLF